MLVSTTLAMARYGKGNIASSFMSPLVDKEGLKPMEDVLFWWFCDFGFH